MAQHAALGPAPPPRHRGHLPFPRCAQSRPWRKLHREVGEEDSCTVQCSVWPSIRAACCTHIPPCSPSATGRGLGTARAWPKALTSMGSPSGVPAGQVAGRVLNVHEAHVTLTDGWNWRGETVATSPVPCMETSPTSTGATSAAASAVRTSAVWAGPFGAVNPLLRPH